MPINNSFVPSPASFPATNSPSNAQVPAYNSTTGGFTWVTQDGATVSTDLQEFISSQQTRGFVNNTQSSISLSGAQLDVFNLVDEGDGIDFYISGALHHVTGDRSIALTGGAGNAHASGLYYIYSDTTALDLKIKTTPFNFTGAEVLIAAIHWNGSLPSGYRSALSDERHTAKWPADIHYYAHRTLGTQIIGTSRGLVTGYTLFSGAKAEKQVSIAQTVIRDEDLEHTLDAHAGGDGTYTIAYRTASDTWGWSYRNDNVFRIADTPSARMVYDNATATGAECDSGTYLNVYVLLTNILGDARHVFITSQTTYPDAPSAIGASFSNLNITGLSIPEYIVLSKMTFEVADDIVGSGHCYIEYFRDMIIPSGDVTPAGIGAPDLVTDSTSNNFVSFTNTHGLQKDSGYSPASITSAVAITGGTITGITDLAVADGGTGASNATSARSNLGLGTIATQAANNVAITGGSVTGITDITVADGGTGASDASTARTNLGLGTIATQASSSVSITGGSVTGITDLAVADGGTGGSDAATARTNLGAANVAGDTFTGRVITKASAAVAGAGFNIQPGVVPNTPVEGDIWLDSTQKSFVMFEGGVNQDFVGCLYTKTNTTTVTASVTNAETSLKGTGVGTTTIPANFLTVGRTIRFRGAGIYTTSANSATMLLRIKCGTSILSATAVLDPNNNLTNAEFLIDGEFVVYSTGAGGTMIGQALFTRASSATAFVTDPMVTVAPVSVDTTASNVLDVTVQYSQTTVGNSISMTTLSITTMN